MKYAIGLDIGIASVGYAVVALDYEENPWGIIKLGSRIFERAENLKDGSPLALPRRLARGARRRLRRHRHRLERIKALLVSASILSEEELKGLYEGKGLSDIYELRAIALDRLVTRQELARILLHLAQRRGFKSNRRSDAGDKEAGQLLSAVSENANLMKSKNYRTAGEMFFLDPRFKEYKRNKGGAYITTVARSMIADEAKQIMKRQKEFGNELLTPEFMDKYLGILLSQRGFDAGPGEPSPYAGNQIENMAGPCTFEPGEFRAPKGCYSFEYFNLLQKINHLRLLREGESCALDESQRKKIIDLAHASSNLTYDKIRKALGIGEDVLFNSLSYNSDNWQGTEKKAKFNYLPVYHQMRVAFDKIAKNHIAALPLEKLDAAGRILAFFKGDDKRIEELGLAGFSEQEIDALLPINCSKTCHLSLVALRKINSFLEQGMIYNEAVASAGYNFRAHDNAEKTLYLPAQKEKMENITSPVARRAITQSIKVINAIIREMDASPTYVNIELAREMAKDYDERQEAKKNMEKNHAYNESLKAELRDNYGIANPTGLDITKLKLWKEQDGRSPYSQEALEASRLFEIGYCDIDHILPYSISFDDTLKNKVLVKASENRDKGNRLPLAYLKAKFGDAAAEHFTVWVNNNVRNYKKRMNLLKAAFTDEDRNRFKERNLQDTKTITRFLYNYINDYLLFAPSDCGRKKKVTAVNGAITSYLRKRWGISKVRADGDKHHAVDALVVACSTDKMIRDLSAYATYREMEYVQTEGESLLANPRTGEILKRFPYPWQDFRPELMARLADDPASALKKLDLVYYSTIDLNNIKPIFVSRRPNRKITGAAHKATVLSARLIDEGLVIIKKNLTDLKLDKNGEIEGYYAPESDALLYNALKERLRAFGNNAAKAFAEPFFKPKSKAGGEAAPLVKKVKICEKTTLNVPVLQKTAVAKNDRIVRVDVFLVPGDGYYLVPIYVADTLKAELPRKAITRGKNYEEWVEMKDENFLFSLYKNDLIKFKAKKVVEFSRVSKESTLPENMLAEGCFVYYQTSTSSTASIEVITHDNSYTVKSLGVKTLLEFEKYQVDVLGNITKVKKEKRQTFR